MSESTRTVERALSLLAVVCARGTVTLTEAGRATDLAPSTALRLLRTLEQSRYVRRDADGAYRPGGQMVELSALTLGSLDVVDVCRAPMRALAASTGESAYLSVEAGGGTAVYVAVVDGTHPVRHSAWVGRTIPLAGSAAGRVFTGEVDEGWTVLADGVEPDITALAAPVRRGGLVVAAMSLLVPTYRADPDTVARHGAALAEASAQVSELLGAVPVVTSRRAAS